MAAQHRIYKKSPKHGALRQGELVSNLIQVLVDLKTLTKNSDDLSVLEKHHPYAIVVTQDCDLEQDYKARLQKDETKRHRLLRSILFCEVYTEHYLNDYPLDEIKKKGTTRNNIIKNKDERFHFFQAVPKAHDLQGAGLPELVVEFKHYFTIPTDEIYQRLELGEIKRRCQLKSPYLEHFGSRFHYYHSRVALPEDHSST